MKILKCDLCEVTAEGESLEQWMKNLMPHYMEAHADIMKGNMSLSNEEKKAEQQKWMKENQIRFDNIEPTV